METLYGHLKYVVSQIRIFQTRETILLTVYMETYSNIINNNYTTQK